MWKIGSKHINYKCLPAVKSFEKFIYIIKKNLIIINKQTKALHIYTVHYSFIIGWPNFSIFVSIIRSQTDIHVSVFGAQGSISTQKLHHLRENIRCLWLTSSFIIQPLMLSSIFNTNATLSYSTYSN
jgi:hypothetical protein